MNSEKLEMVIDEPHMAFLKPLRIARSPPGRLGSF